MLWRRNSHKLFQRVRAARETFRGCDVTSGLGVLHRTFIILPLYPPKQTCLQNLKPGFLLDYKEIQNIWPSDSIICSSPVRWWAYQLRTHPFEYWPTGSKMVTLTFPTLLFRGMLSWNLNWTKFGSSVLKTSTSLLFQMVTSRNFYTVSQQNVSSYLVSSPGFCVKTGFTYYKTPWISVSQPILQNTNRRGIHKNNKQKHLNRPDYCSRQWEDRGCSNLQGLHCSRGHPPQGCPCSLLCPIGNCCKWRNGDVRSTVISILTNRCHHGQRAGLLVQKRMVLLPARLWFTLRTLLRCRVKCKNVLWCNTKGYWGSHLYTTVPLPSHMLFFNYKGNAHIECLSLSADI